MKLRKWVKVSLAIVISIGVIILFTIWSNKETKKCVDGGNSINFCNSIK